MDGKRKNGEPEETPVDEETQEEAAEEREKSGGYD